MTENLIAGREYRLDAFLQEKIPELLASSALRQEISNSKIRRLIVAGCVRVDGVQRRIPAFMLRTGSTVQLHVDMQKFFYEKQPDDIQFTLTEKDVLFEDEAIIVVNKPAFFPTEETIVKGRGNMHQAVIDYLWKKNPSLRNPPYVGIMHRLDRETSGVLLFTKTRSVNGAVHDMFEQHTARKTYRAVCVMVPGKKIPRGTFSVDESIGRISAKSSACKIGPLPPGRGGQHAHTDFTVLRCAGGLVYVEAKPLTGRTHQIRVHLSISGMPIAGDELYGGGTGLSSNGGRIMLHALSLEFPHPADGRLMRIEAPLPAEFDA